MSLRVARFIYRWRRWLSAATVVGALWLSPRAQIQNIDNDLTAWFSRDDPVYQTYERFQDEFGGTRALIIAIEAPDATRMFSDEGLAFLDDISADIERVDAVQRVSSLGTATVVDAIPAAEGDDGGLNVRRLLDDLGDVPATQLGERARADRLFRGDLISADGTVAAIIVFFDEERVDAVRARVLGEIRTMVAGKLPVGFEAHYNGSLEITEWYNRVTLDNQTKFTPPIFVFTLGALFLMFRSWRKTFLTFGAILVSLFWTLGLYDLVGFNYNVLSSMIVPLVVVLAIADDVHILQHYGLDRRTRSHEEAFVATVSHLLAPLFGASTTTALGMLSLATSPVVAVREFGMGSAMGVMVDFVISIVLVPTMLAWVKPEPAPVPQESWFLGPLRRVALFSTHHARAVIVSGAVIVALAGWGMSRLKADTNHINFFSERHELYRSAQVIDSQLAGIYTFQILLEGPADSMQQPDVLQRMDRLSGQLEQLPFVRKVTSLADYVKRVHQELHDGREDAYVLPATSAEVAQELLVFGLGDEGRAELERVVASDYSTAQMTVKLASMSSDLVFQQVNAAQRLADEAFAGSGIAATATGSGKLFSTLDHYLVHSQISSFAMAFVTVFAVIFLVFRSWRFGLLSIAPNLFPVATVFGVMGWLDISLNVATVMVASVALGVVDDDTIHFISRYRKETQRGVPSRDAIEIATTQEGRAALTTALINCCAFGVLMMSEYRPSAWFGGLLALTMVVAFLAEVFILPATITLFPRLFGGGLRPPRAATVTAVLALALVLPAAALAQDRPRIDVAGHVGLAALTIPDRDASEIRTRVRGDVTGDMTPWLRVKVDASIDGLLADRGSRVDAAIVRVRDAWAEVHTTAFDLRLGYGRLVWGRLDEIMPSDVLNPLDTSTYFLEGRSEARLAIAFARARVFLPGDGVLEGLVSLPGHRGRFDLLDEETSPFNLVNDLVLPASGIERLRREEPPASVDSLQYGLRVSETLGRIDLSASVYRGYEAFGTVSFEPEAPLAPGPLVVGQLVERYPRFTMVAADAETVVGPWAVRAEAAFFPDRTLTTGFGARPGRAFDAGVGIDRAAGAYRVFGSVVWHRDWAIGHVDAVNNDLSFVASVERSFARERYRLRVFGVSNPVDDSGFVRALASWSVRDNVLLDLSGGVLFGDESSADTLSRFRDRDFGFLRLSWSF